MKYNSTTNIITTDDINVSSDLNNLGLTVSDILKTQSEKIATLSSNVKWLAKYGGVGGSGGSGSGGGGSQSGKFQFEITINYKDSSEQDKSIIFNQTSSKNQILLVKPNSQIEIHVYRKSVQTLPDDSYKTILTTTTSSININNPEQKFILEKTIYSLNISTAFVALNLAVSGEQRFDFNFDIYSKIVEQKTVIYDTKKYTTFSNNSKIYDDNVDNLYLYPQITNLIPSKYTIKTNSLTINNNQLTIPEDVNLETGSYEIGSYIKQNSYGLYVINYKFDILDLDGVVQDTISTEYQLIYKNANEVYIYCYSKLSNLTVYPNTNYTPETPYSGRQYSLFYIIYGLQTDGSDKTYQVSINGVLQTPLKVETNKSYTFNNTSTETGWKTIEFKVGEKTFNYYVYLTTAAPLSYIYRNPTTNDLYYGAAGATSDENAQTNIIIPSKKPGNRFWQFTEESKIIMDCASPGALANSNINTIGEFITNSSRSMENQIYDCLINIGISYKDSSYDDYIFKIQSGDTQLEFYRNKLNYPSNPNNDRWSIPNDGKFHLITIYLKKQQTFILSDVDEQSYKTLSESPTKFVVYIDGIQETKIDTISDGNFGLNSGLFIQCNKGQTLYNFFSIYWINPRINLFGQYPATVRKYLYDFDPILVSNFAMIYHNQHNMDNYEIGQYSDEIRELEEYQQSQFFDTSLYDNLIKTNLDSSGASWINFYNIGEYTHYKFLPIQAIQIYNLLKTVNGNKEITLYKIKLTQPGGNSQVVQGLHTFLYNTYQSYDQNNAAAKIQFPCSFQKFDGKDWKDLFSSDYIFQDQNGGASTEIKVNYYVRFQGSSTLLYSVKNFEISAQTTSTDTAQHNFSIYFNPNPDVFKYPEESFNLKADLVDSSSCTNNVVGNFVNDYMVSPFNYVNEKYQSCLSGYPVLLFIDNTNDSQTSLDKDIFLGIYNLNLNRSSVNNLGYQQLPDLSNSTFKTDSAENSPYLAIRRDDQEVIVNKKYAVAEIQDNSNLFDFSQYNMDLLSKVMYDDFYSGETSGAVSTLYNNDIQKISKDFANYVYNYIIKDNFNEYNYSEDIQDSWKYNYNDSKVVGAQYEFDGKYYNLQESDIIISSASIKNFKPYNTKDDTNNVAFVGNPSIQFCILRNSNGEIIKDGSNHFYVVKQVNPIFNSENYYMFDLKETIKYYIICMAFAMVDSVQKNLTIKIIDNTGYPEFYDMDTGLGLDNSGNNSNYMSFSDYIENNKIISDYAEDGVKKWFDIPSSLLFLYAKYDYLLNNKKGVLAYGLNEKEATPYHVWCTLRAFNNSYINFNGYGLLENARKFWNNHLNAYIGNKIPPLIWNLNYQYKYFSSTLNDGSTGDTEEKRFNGTMKYRRLEWLDNRFHFLDAMFGIANTRNIGKNQSITISDPNNSTNNADIKICYSMFPNFTKGITGTYNATIKGLPRTPLVFKTAHNEYHFYIMPDNGEMNILETIGSNTDIGFFGTQALTYVNESGQFLSNDNGNEIIGDQIKIITISSDKTQNCTISLNDIPSVDTIYIGRTGSKLNLSSKTISINFTGDEPFVLNNLILENVELSQLTLSNIQFTNLKLNNVKINNTVTISTCTFPKNYKLSADIKKLNINGQCQGNFTITCNTQNFKLSSSSLVVDNVFTINCPSIQSIDLNSLQANELIVQSAQIINHYSCTGYINKCIFNNSAYIGINNTITNYTLSHLCANISPLPLTQDQVYLSLGGFTNLETLELNDNVSYELINGGISRSKIASLPNNVILSESAIDALAFCTKFDINKLTYNFFSKVKNLTRLFYRANPNTTVQTIVNILNWIQSEDKNYLNLMQTFSNLRLSSQPSKEDCVIIANAFPDRKYFTERKYINSVFADSNICYFVKEFVDKLDGFYRSFIGYDNNQITYIEDGTLKNMQVVVARLWDTIIHDYDLGLYLVASYHNHIKFFNNDNLIQTPTYESQLANVSELLSMSVYTNRDENYSFDFGTNGIGNKLFVLEDFNYTGFSAYYVNLENIFKNTRDDFKITRNTSFSNSSPIPIYSSSTDKYYVNLKLFYDNNKNYLRDLIHEGTNANCDHFLMFPKKIDYTDFINMLNDLSLENINNLFGNCVIINCPDDILTLNNKLGKFILLMNSFYNLKAYNTQNQEITIDLNDAFKDAEGIKGSPINLRQTFYNCKLKPFSYVNYSCDLGINDHVVESMSGCFQNCRYDYTLFNSITSDATWNHIYDNKSAFITIEQPSNPYQLIPEYFLNCLTQAAIFENLFSTTVDNQYKLRGCLPNENNFGHSINANNVFSGSIIFYHSEEIEKSSGDYETIYVVFPDWYAQQSGLNLFNTTIPFPFSDPNKKCYLFKTPGTLTAYGNKLPTVPSFNSSGIGSANSETMFVNACDNNNACPKLYANYSNKPILPKSSDLKYNQIIDRYLIFILYVGDTNIEVITDLNTLTENYYINQQTYFSNVSMEHYKEYYFQHCYANIIDSIKTKIQ